MSIDEVMAGILEYGILSRRATVSELRSFRTSIKAAIEQHVAEAVEREREECALICDAESRECVARNVLAGIEGCARNRDAAAHRVSLVGAVVAAPPGDEWRSSGRSCCMTDDEIMDMAREAGFTWEPINNIIGPLRRLTFLVAARAAAEEREACADAAREWEDAYVIEDSAPRHVDAAIRARGQEVTR